MVGLRYVGGHKSSMSFSINGLNCPFGRMQNIESCTLAAQQPGPPQQHDVVVKEFFFPRFVLNPAPDQTLLHTGAMAVSGNTEAQCVTFGFISAWWR